MPARKSQRRAEADKRIEKALDVLSNGTTESIRAIAKEHNVSHSTLLRTLNGGNLQQSHANLNKSSQLWRKMH